MRILLKSGSSDALSTITENPVRFSAGGGPNISSTRKAIMREKHLSSTTTLEQAALPHTHAVESKYSASTKRKEYASKKKGKKGLAPQAPPKVGLSGEGAPLEPSLGGEWWCAWDHLLPDPTPTLTT